MSPSITIVDSIMGSGKTSAMIEVMNQNPDTNYIFITPYLDEIDRVVHAATHPLYQPHQLGQGKLASLHELLAAGKSIAATHALFLRANDETIQLIREGGYTLVLDEALNVLQEFNSILKDSPDKCINKDDVELLLRKGLISIDERQHVSWTDVSFADSHFSEVERLAKNGTLRCIDHALYWEYPVDVLCAFEKIFILTYLFDGSIFSAYLKLYGLDYEKASVEKTEQGTFVLTEYKDDAEIRQGFQSLISIYDGSLNHLGYRHNAFSFRWLLNLKKDEIKTIQNAMRNYRYHANATSNQIMWTTAKKNNFHRRLGNVSGFKYIRRLTKEDQGLPPRELEKLQCFVPCNARATNIFSDRTVLLYLVNRYLPPEIEKYFALQHISLDESLFATSELVQWIWRSAIRNHQPIQIYIPSSRMRKLLCTWLGCSYEPRTKQFEFFA